MSNRFTIKFDKQGGYSGVDEKSWTSDQSTIEVMIPTPGPIKNGSDFVGYCRDSGGSGTIYGLGDFITLEPGVTTLYAIWKTPPQEFDLVYSANGGSWAPGAQHWGPIEKDSLKVNLSPLPATREGYKFLSWNTNSSGTGTNYHTGASITIFPGTTTLYARWQQYKDFTIRYDANGGTGAPAEQSWRDAASTLRVNLSSAVPSYGDRTFLGWTTNSAGAGVTYSPGSSIALSPGVTTMYAQWEAPYVPVSVVSVSGPRKVKIGDTFRASASVSPSDATNKAVDWTLLVGDECVEQVGSSSRWIEYRAVAVGEAHIRATSRDNSRLSDILYVTIESPVEDVTVAPDDGSNRQDQGADKRFTATVTPEDPEAKVIFKLTRGADSNEIVDAGPTTCTVRSSSDTRGDYTLRATSPADVDVYGEYSVRVDRTPVTHGSPEEPVRDLVTADLDDILGDTYYVEEGFSVKLVHSATTMATGISPEGSGMSVDGTGDVVGTLDRQGVYTVAVDYNDNAVGTIPYEVIIHIVKPVDVPATAIDVVGPTEVTEGERVTLTATLQPSDATLPSAIFTPMNGRVVVISQTTAQDQPVTTCILEGRTEGEVVVRITSEDGRIVRDYPMTVLKEAPAGSEWTMEANGGSFPNGLATIRGPTEDGYLLPDWTVVDRPGYRLSGWTAPDGSEGAMGQYSKRATTWTAVWAEDDRHYDVGHLPRAAVRIYRTLDEYIDVTYMMALQGEPVLSMAENRPGSAVMSVINAWRDATTHLLGQGCTLWSAGPAGPIEAGMYVRIEDIQPDGTVKPLMDGFITTMTPNADAGIIRIEIGDRMAFLARAGTSLRRNYYKGREADTLIDAGYDGTVLYGDLSSLPHDSQVEPPYEWLAPKPVTSAVDGEIGVSTPVGYAGRFFSCTIPALPADVVYRIRIHASMSVTGSPREYISRGVLKITSAAGSFSRAYERKFSSREGDFVVDFDMSSYVTPGVPVRGPVTFILTTDVETFGGGTYMVTFPTKTDPSASITYAKPRVGGSGFEIVTEQEGIQMDIDGFRWASCTAHRDGNRLIVDSISDYPNYDTPDFYEPASDRMRVQYLSQDIPTTEVMSGIARAVGQYPLPNTSGLAPQATGLKIFRAGGGYAQDYLQKLADISSKDGRGRAFRSIGYQTPALLIGSRHKVSDIPRYALAYGGDVVSGETPVIEFSAFSPNITLKNRPSLVMVRGTGTSVDNRSVPLMVAIENASSRRRRYGLSVEQVLSDSSVSSPLGAASAGYAQVNARDLDRWEGSITLPGIWDELMDLTGIYAGSGVPVLLHDSRNGLVDYPARVKELRLDYNACTSTATLVNFGLVYSSAIGDTVATAITAADVATGSTDMSLYETQYVRVVSEVPQTLDRTNLVNSAVIVKGDGSERELSNLTFLDLPDGRTVLVAVGPPDGDGHTDNARPYDVVGVRINGGVQIDIPAPLRPDYYVGQTLIVNVDFPTD